MRFILNGQMTVAGQPYWRVDDVEKMSAPDYEPLTFLSRPFALINAMQTTHEQAGALIEKWNETVPA